MQFLWGDWEYSGLAFKHPLFGLSTRPAQKWDAQKNIYLQP